MRRNLLAWPLVVPGIIALGSCSTATPDISPTDLCSVPRLPNADGSYVNLEIRNQQVSSDHAGGQLVARLTAAAHAKYGENIVGLDRTIPGVFVYDRSGQAVVARPEPGNGQGGAVQLGFAFDSKGSATIGFDEKLVVCPGHSAEEVTGGTLVVRVEVWGSDPNDARTATTRPNVRSDPCISTGVWRTRTSSGAAR